MARSSTTGKPGIAPDMERNYEAERAAYDKHRESLDRLPQSVAPALKSGAKDTPARRKIIIAWLEKGYSLGRAAEEAGITRHTLQVDWRKKDPAFDEQCRAAIERGTDLLEDEVRRRATEGVDRPVFQQGECVGFTREYSDSLMSMLIGGKRSTYQRQRTEHSGPEGGPIQHKIEVEFVKPEGK